MLERAQHQHRLGGVAGEQDAQRVELLVVHRQDFPVLVIDRAGGELQQLVAERRRGWCRHLAVCDVCEHLLFKRPVLLARVGRQRDRHVDNRGCRQVAAIADDDQCKVGQPAVDLFLRPRLELESVTHVVRRIKPVGFVVGERFPQPIAIVQHLHLHEQIQIVVRDRRAGQPPAARDV